MGNYVKYFGTAGVRVITADEWRQAGVNDMETVTWHAGNGYMVSREKFSDDAWPFIKADVLLFEVSSDSVEAGKDADPSVVRETVTTASGGPSGLVADA
jgi:hypothetical protein